ncbi:blue copper protein-like [Camellia sinensis]|uniref:blue copper protein-like n=1 Tax=Camellia sinensis TaxID=4442 RepID=UPI00103619AC|nr:blue copper protein-like [Camellia sinensis]
MDKQYLLTFFVVAIVFPSVTLAKEFIVGDEAGWTTTGDYEGWVKGKEFRIGDKLVFKYTIGLHNVYPVDEYVFKYTIGLHNVYPVDEYGYKNCIIPQNGVLDSGEDTITLETPGPKYFVCGVGLHCEKGGQKLSVDVKQGDTQGPTHGEKTYSQSFGANGSPYTAPSQSPTTNGSPYVAPSQSQATNGSPYATPSQFSIANDSPNGAPSQSSISSDSSNSSNGLRKIGCQQLLAILVAIVALIVI